MKFSVILLFSLVAVLHADPATTAIRLDPASPGREFTGIGYRLILAHDGVWKLNWQDNILAAGKSENFDKQKWHMLRLEFEGAQIRARLNGDLLAKSPTRPTPKAWRFSPAATTANSSTRCASSRRACRTSEGARYQRHLLWCQFHHYPRRKLYWKNACWRLRHLWVA